jgi:glucokinase
MNAGTEARGAGLVADIGGTNARFGWADAEGGPVRHVVTLPVAAHASLALAIRAYLAQVAPQLPASERRPRRAVLAVAGAVGGDEVGMTNSPWRFSRHQLGAELGLDAVQVLNDFEALALSLPGLAASQLRAVGPALALPPSGTLAVIGPGTGLGVAGVLQLGRQWRALPGEGGHVTLAAADEFEAALLAQVRRRHDHVSAERLLSGTGLPELHGAVAAVRGRPAAPLDSAAIVARGLAGGDDDCTTTLDVFCALLGSLAGNVALTLGARGGVYIGGGIVPRLGERFFASRFRERFEAKGRFRSYLQTIPTALITDTLAALSGAALALRQSDGAHATAAIVDSGR